MSTYLKPIMCSYQDEVDAFKWGSSESVPCSFKNILNQTLIPYPERSLVAFQSFRDTEETDGSQPIFFLKKYRELALHTKGLAVAITFKENNINYILSVNSDFSITLEQRELPQHIPETESEIIFYQKVFRPEHPNSFRFESSVKRNYYLGFSWDDNERKLVLKSPEDGLDETIKFILDND
ncbi:interleukin-18 [Pyxicephalus adspersus]